ncbi:agmatine deiminase family protein [Chromohalobacter israelensis]|uniref:agmatine deiminase family protein n=1 Tax=Chromohalobacter israelensis TaxID=141390 RepID=UPI00265BC483|nr:agmatine deiminase family protein [Chromohalobacter salexigens]MDO0944667.1 agmatine deiminase family protein [Chromohalobacter salexigens]
MWRAVTPSDRVAQATLAELFPRHRIVGIESSREILLGGGNVACITMPQYAAPTPPTGG